VPTAELLAPEASERVVQRLRVVAVCAVLTAATFLQEPGRIATDTKLDLTADPWRFLGRALHLWEPLGFFGQVQDQAYGYLFPMGPFFALGHTAGLPAWVIQRLWISALLCIAVIGVNRLAARLEIGTPTSRLIGAMAYALAPRMMSTLGPTSIEALPMALAPWVLAPLVRGARGGSPRRAALTSAVMVFCVGGVNATATVAVLPLAVLFLLTRARGPRRRQLIRWWVPGVLAACLWWLVPLLLLGRYSPPFLSWIESARITTGETSLVEVLRGTSHWLGYLAGTAGPEWRGGWLVVTRPAAVLDTGLLAGAGLLGLCLRGMPERRLLRLGLLAGILLVCFGHVGAADGLGAEWQRTLLDGALAPLRNVHKFDPVLRLPLALGLTHLIARVLHPTVPTAARRPLMVGAVGLVVVGLIGAGSPLLTGELVPRGSFAEVPAYWAQAAGWLGAHTVDGRALLVPGASFGDYYWGRPRDEPLQALATTPWVVRDAVPFTSAEAIRALDAVQSRLNSGTISPGLSTFLARSGIEYLVVRNDLDYAVAGAPRPVLVHQTLDQSGGLRRVAAFGPFVGGGSTTEIEVDQQLDRPYPAVEIYEVAPRADLAVYIPASDTGAVQAGSEGLLDALDAAAPVPSAALLDDGSGPAAPMGTTTSTRMVTDTPARREVDFGRVDHHASAVLTPTDPLRLANPARDYLPPGARVVSASQEGVARLSASSSVADAGTPGGTKPEHAPSAAVDGDPSTSWVAGGVDGAVGAWIRLDFERPMLLGGGTLQVARDLSGPQVDVVTVVTDAGSLRVAVPPDGRVPLPDVRTRFMTVRADEVAGGGPGYLFGVSEIAVPGILAPRPLVVPVQGSASSYVLSSPVGRTGGCVRVGDRPLCAVGLGQPGEQEAGIDRILAGSTAGTYAMQVQAVARPSASLEARLSAGADLKVTASSSSVNDPDGVPARVADGDLRSGWVASPVDHTPTLTFAFDSEQTLSGIHVVLDPGLAASGPGAVVVRMQGRTQFLTLDSSGFARFPSTRTRVVKISFTTPRVVQSYDPFTRQLSELPIGASEVWFTGAEQARATLPDRAIVSWGCGQGPNVVIDGHSVGTSGSSSVGLLRMGQPVVLRACVDSVQVPSDARVRALSTSDLVVRSVTLTAPDSAVSADRAIALSRPTWGPTDRTVDVPTRAGDGLLAVRETANSGWTATLGDAVLTPATVDGWQQGWRLPAGAAGAVHLVYAPDRTYRLGLAAGLLAVLLLLAGAFVRRGDDRGSALDPAGPAEWSTHSRIDPWVLATAAAVLALTAAAALPVLGLLVAAALYLPRRWGKGVLLGAVVVGAGIAFIALVFHPWASGDSYAGAWAWVQLSLAGAIAAVATVPPSSGDWGGGGSEATVD